MECCDAVGRGVVNGLGLGVRELHSRLLYEDDSIVGDQGEANGEV